MAKGYTLSAVILSFNSVKKLEKCIASLQNWADEIIIVDGQSSDGTIELCKRLSVKLFSHSFLGSFAQERNFGAKESKSQWILQLDSDEIVSEEFKNKCDQLLPQTKYAAFKFGRRNNFLGHTFTYGGWYHLSQHLYKNNFARYEGRVHEKMIANGDVGTIDADILHYPFDSIGEFVERQNRYTDLQAQDILDSEDSLNIRKIRYNLTLKPLKLFKKMYFDKRGYKEGLYGFIFAVLFSFVHFIKWAKVWEEKKT